MSRETVNPGDRLVISDSAAIANLNAFTWGAWVYCESPGLGSTIGHFFAKGPSPTVIHKRLRVASETRLAATITRGSVSAFAQSVSGTLPFGAWAHIAMTYAETDGVRLYRNGDECGYVSRAAGSGATAPDQGSDLVLMNSPDGALTFDGRLAEVGLWNRVLSASEIALLGTHRYSPALLRSGLAGAWRLLGNAAPEPDLVNGNHAAVIGTAPAAHPPGIIAVLPERTTMSAMLHGELRRMG